MLGLVFFIQQMFELISATGQDAAIYKTKQMPRTPGEHGFWVSTAYVDVLINMKAQVLLRCCWLRHDDKFHFQLTFFRDVINETFIHLRLTRITFPWIQANRRHFQKTSERA